MWQGTANMMRLTNAQVVENRTDSLSERDGNATPDGMNCMVYAASDVMKTNCRRSKDWTDFLVQQKGKGLRFIYQPATSNTAV